MRESKSGQELRHNEENDTTKQEELRVTTESDECRQSIHHRGYRQRRREKEEDVGRVNASGGAGKIYK